MKQEIHGCECNHDANSITTQTSSAVPNNHITTTFSVLGMDCADEVSAIQRALSDPQISSVHANIMLGKVSVTHDRGLSSNDLKKRITATGVRIPSQESKSFFVDNSKRVKIVTSSGLFLLVGLLLEWFGFSNHMFIIVNYFISGVLASLIVFPKAIRAVKERVLDMNVLMTMAVLGAFAIKQFSEGASVIFLFALAELLEAFSVDRARRAIREVLSITPQMAQLQMADGSTAAVQVEKIKIGDLFQVRPGERIPLDGDVVEGSSYVNQAPLTGESLPASKKKGDAVFAGTINDSGFLLVQATGLFEDTKISQVIRFVEEAQKQKAPSQRFVDIFARYYTPTVTILAVLVFLLPPLLFEGSWSIWFYRSLVFLVIACPCALVIATPVAIVSGLTALAKRGILVKGGASLEALGHLKAIALDKTGTVTEGKPTIRILKILNGNSEKEVLRIAASMETQSTHPLARAIVRFAEEKEIQYSPAIDFQSSHGRGGEGKIDNHHYFIGNHKFAHELGVCTPDLEKYLEELEQQALSVVIVGHQPHKECTGEVIGIFGIGDALKENTKTAIAALRLSGVLAVEILSGDNQQTVDAIARQIGVDSGRGDLLPGDKSDRIKELLQEFKYVGMVGDGINDAPALAQATVGIAMGTIGSDTAIETADVALFKDDLTKLAEAIFQGRNVVKMIRFNIGIALATKAVFLILTIFGVSNLWMAVAADMGASLFVIGNSLRLLKNSTPTKESK